MPTIDDFMAAPCEGSETMPYPWDCTKYVVCASGKRIQLDCAPGTHFDMSLNVCNWPWAANCTPVPMPTP